MSNFGVENTSSRNYQNIENKFLVIGEEPTNDINDSIGETEKRLSINFTKLKGIFYILH